MVLPCVLRRQYMHCSLPLQTVRAPDGLHRHKPSRATAASAAAGIVIVHQHKNICCGAGEACPPTRAQALCLYSRRSFAARQGLCYCCAEFLCPAPPSCSPGAAQHFHISQKSSPVLREVLCCYADAASTPSICSTTVPLAWSTLTQLLCCCAGAACLPLCPASCSCPAASLSWRPP